MGKYGTLLGVIAEPRLADHALELRPGDALILYTDGLTDAHAPRRIVTAPQLIAQLKACAGQPAAEIVARIQGTLVDADGGEPRDDIAVLALRVL